MKTKQVNNEAFDERFYFNSEKVNPRTENNYFPSVTRILQYGPMSPQLLEFYMNRGHDAPRFVSRRADLGSFAHNMIESQIKYDKVYTPDEIIETFKDSKEALFINRCMFGFYNFILDHQPVILNAESQVYGEDFAGTKDLQVKINDDDYTAIWTIDIKTSKNIWSSHKMQVEAYRMASGDDMGATLQIGNTTRKRYTFSPIKEKDQDKYWNMFEAVKEVFYVWPDFKAEPTIEALPDKFFIPLEILEAYKSNQNLINEESISDSSGDPDGSSGPTDEQSSPRDSGAKEGVEGSDNVSSEPPGDEVGETK